MQNLTAMLVDAGCTPEQIKAVQNARVCLDCLHGVHEMLLDGLEVCTCPCHGQADSIETCQKDDKDSPFWRDFS